ncbi:MAG TPA: hypothetical protein VNU47_00715 [Candidatus Paceibacterota bacterium]|nr:hypothetical protein [Candidatus Paceibacterota bacterium]
MARPIFEWQGKEYAFEEKSADWYWALGIIAIAGIIACVLFNNIILALVIAAGAVSIALHAAKHPRIHRFAITDEGIAIDTNFYPYENMLHFSVLEYADPSLPPSLSIKTKSLLVPHLLIPIVGHDPLQVYEYVLNHLDEGRHDQSVIDHLVDMMRI